IPEARMEAVFEPFVRLDPARNRSTGGSGLGLSIARSVMRSHGGDITLVNRSGGGLVVHMVLADLATP
ncbi:MAG: two-component sensor histidine kinase, partial [Halioglobus sp.]|nr:two-component sensor histidine kinase [Halioglobus sp.]